MAEVNLRVEIISQVDLINQAVQKIPRGEIKALKNLEIMTTVVEFRLLKNLKTQIQEQDAMFCW